MTREQHLDAARRASHIASIRWCQAVSDHPFDNDQAECMETAIVWFIIAWHHARCAQRCACVSPRDGFIPLPPYGACDDCRGERWMPTSG